MKTYKSKIHAAKAYASRHGDRGSTGGWIYDKHWRPITQGWLGYAHRLFYDRRISPQFCAWKKPAGALYPTGLFGTKPSHICRASDAPWVLVEDLGLKDHSLAS